MEWQLRPAVSADRDFLFEVHRHALGPYIERVWGWDDAEQRAHFDRAFDAGGWQLIISGDVAVGMMRTTETEVRVYLDDIEIIPAWQGRGLGTAIVTWLVDRAQADGKETALQVLRINPARRLYERLGFVAVGADGIHLRMRRPVAGSTDRCSSESASAQVAHSTRVEAAGSRRAEPDDFRRCSAEQRNSALRPAVTPAIK